MKDLESLHLFTRVARLRSFSAAARERGLAQSQVSRMIAALEADVQARLLSRTTRAVTLTEAGTVYLAQIEPALAAIEDAQNSIRDTGELRGQIRIAMPSATGTRVIIPRLGPFVERNPGLQLDLMLDDRWQDMVRDAVDVGIRVGWLPDAAGTSRQIGSMERIFIASPDYVTRFGMPENPAALRAHRIVGGPVGTRSAASRWQRNGEAQTTDLRPQISTNDTEGTVKAAVAGLGIAVSTSWACRAELDSGALVNVLPEWKAVSVPVHAYFPQGRATRMAARAFVEFIASAIRADPAMV